MKKILTLVLAVPLLLAACQPTPSPTPPQPAQTATPSAAPPTPTATLPPPTRLTVCLGQEPESLYRYAGSGRALATILEALYDGPVDTLGYQQAPVLLEQIPGEQNGAVVFQPVEVTAGQWVIDAGGQLAALERGLRVRPAGCREDACAAAWDGQSPLLMDQQVVSFRLQDGWTWSDGQPVTADDSLFSYQIAADPATPNSKRLVDRTAGYTAEGDLSVQWKGIPGYRALDASSLFFAPLPRHAWGERSAAELLAAEDANRAPLGWGAYVVSEWIPGERLTLVPSEHYARADEFAPDYDLLEFRFTGSQPDQVIAALLSGECDIADPSAMSEDALIALKDLEASGELQVQVGQGPEWEQLAFGIRLAEYDAGYNVYGVRRQDIFGDSRVRQAFAYCLDRTGMVEELQSGYGQVAAGLLPPGHPQAAGDTASYPFDPHAGSLLLEQAGWLDTDNDPATPRIAQNIASVLNGTPLAVQYLTTDAPQRRAAAVYLSQSLAQCGIQATPVFMTSESLYAEGPEGPLFGRDFDLAQFAWQASSGTACFLYESEQVPAQGNAWLGVNVTGYSDPDYDAACRAAREGDPAAGQRAEQLFAEDVPAVPLYYHLQVLAARPEVCGLQLDPGARSALWNIEALRKECG